MSENPELYPHGGSIGSSFIDPPSPYSSMRDLNGLDPFPHLSFTDCLQSPVDCSYLWPVLALPHSPPAAFSPAEGAGGTASELTQSTGGENFSAANPNSSESWSLSEAHREEDMASCKRDHQQAKKKAGIKDGGGTSKKANGWGKKGEKRQRELRFAFITRSQVDNLEDGYRWRKYGQKAVKKSVYPRSYYKCSSQKCSVKKHVERWFEDASMVITTYEGQHSHPIPSPATLNPGFLASPLMGERARTAPSFRHDQEESTPMRLHIAAHHQHPLQFAEHGLLQDIVPSFFP